MFAIDHAATALLIKRRYPSVSLAPILVSVQGMELAWVALNAMGIERTTTGDEVHTVADIHLSYMPYSHSVVTAVAATLLAWLALEKGLGRAALGRAVGLGIFSHLIRDLATHDHDLVLWPGFQGTGLGLGLYGSAPLAAFAVELVYGVLCWWVYRGRRALLAVIVLGNVANLPLFSSAVPGPKAALAGHPTLIVAFVAVQIVVTLVMVGLLAHRPRDVGDRLPSAEDAAGARLDGE